MNELTDEQVLAALYRQFPLWPSTFGKCIASHSDADSDKAWTHKPARGSGFCSVCLGSELVRRGASAESVSSLMDYYQWTVSTYHTILGELEEAR